MKIDGYQIQWGAVWRMAWMLICAVPVLIGFLVYMAVWTLYIAISKACTGEP